MLFDEVGDNLHDSWTDNRALLEKSNINILDDGFHHASSFHQEAESNVES